MQPIVPDYSSYSYYYNQMKNKNISLHSISIFRDTSNIVQIKMSQNIKCFDFNSKLHVGSTAVYVMILLSSCE